MKTSRDYLNIKSYKHDGSLHRVWEKSYLLSQDENMTILVNQKTVVIESDGRTWTTREPAICCFFKDNWFNVICMIKKNGVYYYCNIASPFLKNHSSLKYIDYDLDIKVYPDGSTQLLDEDEYLLHKEKMSYGKDIETIIEYQTNKLKQMIENEQGPFKKGFVESKYQQYIETLSEKNI